MENVEENFCIAQSKETLKSIVHSEWQEKLQGNDKPKQEKVEIK